LPEALGSRALAAMPFRPRSAVTNEGISTKGSAA
jgi:hypothetical protein